MAKYFKASDYYPDDKDIYDFLDSQTRTTKQMASFLKSRYIFSSKDSDKEHLQTYISLLYFDWPSATKLVDYVNIRETEQKISHTKVGISAEVETVNNIVNEVKDERHDNFREIYQITNNGDDIEISVLYIDVDTSKTRVLQKREKELQIIASKEGDEWAFRFTNTERSKTIISNIKRKLMSATEAEDCEERIIDISHINSHVQRVEFFKTMMTDIQGFQLRSATTLKVDRLSTDSSSEDGEDDNEDEENSALQYNLNKVIMYGSDLFTVREFQDLVDEGFFISSAQWKSQKTDSSAEIVEFSAGFNDSKEGKNFDYKVLGIYRLDDTGNLKMVRERVYGAEKSEYLSALEKSAYNALESTGDNDDEPSI